MLTILNERKFVQELLQGKHRELPPHQPLSLLARYYSEQGKAKKEVETLLTQFLNDNYPRYAGEDYSNLINRYIKQAQKYKLLEIDAIHITKTEMENIQTIDFYIGTQARSRSIQKLLFCMVCYAKYSNLVNPANNNWVNRDVKELFRAARLTATFERQIDYQVALEKLGCIEFNNHVNKVNNRVTFIEPPNTDSEIVMSITDFRELGYQYLQYLGAKYTNCEKCGVTMKPRSGKVLCPECMRIQLVEQSFTEKMQKRSKNRGKR